MLKKFPENALGLARDGVIPARALGQAVQAAQLQRAARQRASDLLVAASQQADEVREHARREGYAAGYAEAMATAVPHLIAQLGDLQAVRRGVLRDLRELLQRTLAAEGVAADLVLAQCEQMASVGETIVVHVPAAEPALSAALRARLGSGRQPWQVRLAESNGTLPMLEVGPLLRELDPVTAVMAAVDAGVDTSALQHGAEQRAQAYAARFAFHAPMTFPPEAAENPTDDD